MHLRSARFDSNLRFVMALGVAALIWGAAPDRANAQAPSIMAPGDTIVTGFSGVPPPVPPFPSGDSVDETFINLDGPSMQIQRPQPSSPPAGQLIPSPTVFSAPARTVGQVFAITLDDQPVPNIFLGATSAFGLQIVAPDNDGDGRPERVKTGQPDAAFMDGQWGAGGSPGSIYRVDGTTGAVTLFTSIGADSGPGIGDIVFDKATHQFFVSDLDSGLIYRLDWTGTILDTFDHGVAGRPAHGLAPVADDGSAMSVTDPGFNAEDPTTWGYTQKERMVWGMAVHGGRLYYAATDGPQIWSVGINLDGTFGAARWELDVTGLASTNPISDMVFDGSGRMILAQRGLQRGSYDYSVFADPAQSSVVRYTREVPDDPATPSVWVATADEFAIGFRPDGHNATGGVALGYGYDTQGRMRNGACYQFLWSTGDSLRDNPAIADQLAAGGPAVVHGLQGNDEDLVRPDNDPPFISYFTDYDSTYDDPQNQGHMGDVEIWQPCDGYVPPYFPPPIYIPPPPPQTFNLTIEKRAYECASLQDAWFCWFTVRVSNTGTTPYWGPITVDDALPAVPVGAVMSFSPQPPWLCGSVGPDDYQCTYPPVFLLPGDGVDLFVTVKLPPRYQPCSLVNTARIVWPLGWGDAIPADDFAWAVAGIPTKQCQPPKDQKTNLKLQKFSYPKVCTDTGSDWVCNYLVEVTNMGPGVFNGPIQITETLSSGTPITVSAPWSCVPSGPSYLCTHPGVLLNPGDPVFMVVTTSISKAVQQRLGQCSIGNKAQIFSPVNNAQNTILGDDGAGAEDLTPGKNCEPIGKKSDLWIKKEAKGCIQYPSNDRKSLLCSFIITVGNNGPDGFFAPIQVQDTMTPASLPPGPWFLPALCGPDGGGGYLCNSGGPLFIAPHTSLPPLAVVTLVPDDGQTCTITNKATITSPVASNLNTLPGNDSDTAVLHVRSEKCDPIEILKQVEPLCPIDQQMPGGGCCLTGKWNGRSCGTAVVPTCPPNTIGTFPVCKSVPEKPKSKPKPKKCPDGYYGNYPECTLIPRQSCPAGTLKDFPKCTPIACPEGYSGKYPTCVPPGRPCPPGYAGTFFPDCKLITGPTNNNGGGVTKAPENNNQPKACPPGTTGLFQPFCIPNQQDQQIK